MADRLPKRLLPSPAMHAQSSLSLSLTHSLTHSLAHSVKQSGQPLASSSRSPTLDWICSLFCVVLSHRLSECSRSFAFPLSPASLRERERERETEGEDEEAREGEEEKERRE